MTATDTANEIARELRSTIVNAVELLRDLKGHDIDGVARRLADADDTGFKSSTLGGDGQAVGGHSDPVGDRVAASRRPGESLLALKRLSSQLVDARRVLHVGTRPTVASAEEKQTATVAESMRTESGVCEACGRPVTRGREVSDANLLCKPSDATGASAVLCGSHLRQWKRWKSDPRKDPTLAAFVASYTWRRTPDPSTQEQPTP